MKRIFFLLMGLSFLFIACNNNKPKNADPANKDSGQKTIADPKVKEADNFQKIKDDLDKLTPLSADELKALLPEQLMDAPVSGADVDGGMGASVANADYKVNDSTELKLEIVDCAGSGGVGLFGMQYVNMIDQNNDDDEEYTKTIDFNGGKAFETCQKNKINCTLKYFSGNRFLVTLQGDGVGIDELKSLARGLRIK